MSIIRKLWIAIAAITLLALGGSLVVGTLSPRHQGEHQLSEHRIDSDRMQAPARSQIDKEKQQATAIGDRQVAPPSDTGLFRLIGFADLGGNAIGGQLLLWFIGCGMLCGLAGTALVTWITRPLRGVVEQAEAIGGGRFVTTPEPRTQEFRAVVKSMNTLSERVRDMLEQESRHLEELRRKTQHDELTGLFNRNRFLDQLDSALAREDRQAGGAFVLLRLRGLAALNQELGRSATDAMLLALAERLRNVAASHAESACGRMNASDFAILTAGGKVSATVAADLDMALDGLLTHRPAQSRLLIAAADYAPGESRSHLLARIDGALAAAEESGEQHIHLAQGPDAAGRGITPDEWRAELDAAIDQNRLRLERFAVVGRDGQVLHHEMPVRLMLHGSWHNAARFLPWAARLGLVTAIDARVVRAAINCLDNEADTHLAIKLSAEALCDGSFRDSLHAILRSRPLLARRLWIEVQEQSALRHQVEFRALCLALRPLGSKIGLEQAGQDFSRVAQLHGLGVDYLKISANFVRGIDASPGNQAFVRGLCAVAHSIGLIAIAAGVSSEGERDCLVRLGVDGVTGPAVR